MNGATSFGSSLTMANDQNVILSTDAWGKGALHFNSNISRASTSTDFVIQRGGVASEQDYLVQTHRVQASSLAVLEIFTGRSLTITLVTLGFTRLCLQLT